MPTDAEDFKKFKDQKKNASRVKDKETFFFRRDMVADHAVRLVLGATEITSIPGLEEICHLAESGTFFEMHIDDANRVKAVAEKLEKSIKYRFGITNRPSINDILVLRKYAAELAIKEFSAEGSKGTIAVCPGDYAGCWFWRIFVPFAFMSKNDWTIEGHIYEKADHWFLEKYLYDVIVFQRTSNPVMVHLMITLKEAGVKIVIDTDDHLLNMPADHPRRSGFDDPLRRRALVSALDVADMITVTTDQLKDAMGEFSNKTVVLPNAIYPELFPGMFYESNNKRTNIFYTGSDTHEPDFPVCQEALFEVMRTVQNSRMTFMGFVPKEIMKKYVDGRTGQIKSPLRLGFMNAIDVKDFPRAVSVAGAHIGIAPLVENEFNDCKSAVKYYEYAMMNIPIVATDFGPYRREVKHGETGLLVKTKKEWVDALTFLIEKPEERERLAKNAKADVLENHNIESSWEQYDKVYSELMAR